MSVVCVSVPQPSWSEEGGFRGMMDSPSKINDNKLRKRGRRHYDPVHGVCCHWCRQKTVDDHVKCSNCPLRFCGLCLLNRHGEDIRVETEENVRWVCPRCRGGCGAGCTKSCCNCGPCRKTKRLDPTGPLVRVARSAGFSNVHDYLIHLETGESPEAIASRKVGRGWTSIDISCVGKLEYKLENKLEHQLEDHLDDQLEHDANLAWAKKRLRSLRWCVANSKWGNREPIRGHLQTARLLVARLNSMWEIGQKRKSWK